ncbi:MAG: hypothetical protein JSU92_14885 [Deltaproteobacteria bacterium]|nr:MAG: hypothetical protein JSU92_14885 [Deltaproteobacteria bacterium]
MRSLGKNELKELLNKNWMTHDAMWFLHCLQTCGIEKTNEINTRAAKSMSSVEVKRYKKVFGIEKAETFEDLKTFLEEVFRVIKPEFMKFSISFPGQNIVRWEWEPEQCFAYQGVKGLGIIDQYQCAIFLRPETWFNELGLTFEVSPQVDVCMMHTKGECFRDYKFEF